jgi:hypothetical protein
MGWNVAELGRVAQPLGFHNGAAVVDIPKGSDPADLRVRRFWDDAFGSADVQVAAPLLDPPIGEQPGSVVPLAGAHPSRVAQPHAELRRSLLDAGIAVDPGEDPLAATGRVRGDEVLVGGTGSDSKGHVYAVVLRSGGITTVIDGGALDYGGQQPAVLRLPLHDGWVVIGTTATLRWRSGTGRWNAVRNAVIIPEAATDLETTAKNGHRTVTPLP